MLTNMKRLSRYILGSKVELKGFDKWEFTGIFGLAVTCSFILEILHLVFQFILFLTSH